MKPKRLTDQWARKGARYTRDRQWRFMERVFESRKLWFCVWNKHGKPEGPDEWRDCLMSGMDILNWMGKHPRWFLRGKWDEQRYAFPVRLTQAGKEAMFKREQQYDMEPIHGGLVEPGYVVMPLPRKERSTRTDG